MGSQWRETRWDFWEIWSVLGGLRTRRAALFRPFCSLFNRYWGQPDRRENCSSQQAKEQKQEQAQSSLPSSSPSWLIHRGVWVGTQSVGCQVWLYIQSRQFCGLSFQEWFWSMRWESVNLSVLGHLYWTFLLAPTLPTLIQCYMWGLQHPGGVPGRRYLVSVSCWSSPSVASGSCLQSGVQHFSCLLPGVRTIPVSACLGHLKHWACRHFTGRHGWHLVRSLTHYLTVTASTHFSHFHSMDVLSLSNKYSSTSVVVFHVKFAVGREEFSITNTCIKPCLSS